MCRCRSVPGIFSGFFFVILIRSHNMTRFLYFALRNMKSHCCVGHPRCVYYILLYIFLSTFSFSADKIESVGLEPLFCVPNAACRHYTTLSKKMLKIENVGLEPLCCIPNAVCPHYTTFSLSPQPVTIRQFRFGKPVCCQLHHADMRLQSGTAVFAAVPVPVPAVFL